MQGTESDADPGGDRSSSDPYADGTLVRDPQPETELGQSEFDPTGTMALLLVYFLILVLMWTYMYFVEFLGNGPTVIG